MIQLVEIGTVKNSVLEETDFNWGEVVSEIVLNEEYTPGLAEINAFSHLIIVFFMHQADFDPVKHIQRHPRDIQSLPLTGIFGQRAKHRPNPIGVTTVKLVDVDDNILKVQGLDAINGTPVLDIKPYVVQFDAAENPSVAKWMDDFMKNYF